jgi:hypothetical protein
MDALAAATTTAGAVSTVGSHFMLDGKTYQRGAELGFQGLDFYVTGRGGVLGDVDADVVSAAFTFFEPGAVRTLWEQGLAVLPADAAGREFAACAASWADDHVPDDVDAARVAELAGQVVAAARPACAAVFAGFRALPVPASPKAAAIHQMNALRELRLGLHGAAVIAGRLTPLEALSTKTPQMAPLFGWPDLAEVTPEVQARWDDAEDRTNQAIAHAYEGLDEAGRDELSELVDVLHRATSG